MYFADADGNRVEPNGRVNVTIEYKTPAAPELTDAASTSVTAEKLHYNSNTGETEVTTLQPNEELKVLNVNESKQLQTLQVQTSNAAVFAVMWDAPEVQDAEDDISVEAEEPAADGDFTDGDGTSDPEVTPTETPAADPAVTEHRRLSRLLQKHRQMTLQIRMTEIQMRRSHRNRQHSR